MPGKAKGPHKPAPNPTAAAARARRGASPTGIAKRSASAKAHGRGGRKK